MSNERMKPRTNEKESRQDGFYRHPETGRPHVSVTTVIDNTINKPALYTWHGNMALAAITENPDILKLPQVEARKMVRAYTKDYTDRAKERGSRVHSMVEAYLAGAHVDPVGDDIGYLDALQKWQTERGVQILSTESTVYSHPDLRYAGTMDALAYFQGERDPFVVDFKTSSGLYPEYNYQVAAYAAALEADEGIRIAGTEVVQLTKEGIYKTQMVGRGEMQSNFAVFRGAQLIYEDRNRKRLEKMGYFGEEWEIGDLEGGEVT